MDEPNDDLLDLLAPRPGQSSPLLRETLLRGTENRLVRDRWLRRGFRMGAITAVFLAGGLSGWLVHRSPEPPAPTAPEVVLVPVIVPIPMPAKRESVPSSPVVARPPSASEAELQAEQANDPTEAAKLYRLAGDTFLREQDYPNASRCYRLFLTRAGDPGLLTDADDSWLLTSLKNAAFKEKTHVPKTVD